MSDWRARRAQYLLAKDDLEHPVQARARKVAQEKKPHPQKPVARHPRIPGELSWTEKDMTQRALASVERLLWLRERGKDATAHFSARTARTKFL